MSLTDGLDAAAKRENEFHPKTDKGAPITAWDRRAVALKEHAQRIELLEQEVAALPFPFGGVI